MRGCPDLKRVWSMAIDSFLNAVDSARVARTFLNLARHNISRWALTGGVAIELHILRLGGKPLIRRLNDLDFLAASFDSIPETIGSELLLRHVHPHILPARSCCWASIRKRECAWMCFAPTVWRWSAHPRLRSPRLPSEWYRFRIWSRDTLALNWDLVEGRPVDSKYARDFLRLIELVKADEVEQIRQEHRKSQSPESFAETALQLRRTIVSRSDPLIPPTYSTYAEEGCPRCRGAGAFPLCDPRQILSILGYC
jgi:hypothetical protein